MSLGTLGLAFLAGALSVLSPCVLPLLPIMLGSAASEHRLAPAALAAGLSLSFVVIGLFVATVGFAAGLDTGFFRLVSAVLLIAVGTLLLVPRLGAQAAAAGGPVSNWVEGQFGGIRRTRARWSIPARLAAARFGVLASGRRLARRRSSRPRARICGEVALTMVAFGIGAAVPLIAIGLLSREALSRWRGRLMEAGKGGKVLLGGVLIAIGLLVATGLDKRLETFLVDASPAWLTRLTTEF